MELIVGIVDDSVALYARPADDAQSGTTSRDKLQAMLPLVIKGKQGDFVEVQLNGKDTWLDLLNVERQFAENYCAKFSGQEVSSMAVARGIGSACK